MLLIALVIIGSLAVSALTFFTGFGLGTLLLPFFLVVFPPGVAVAAVAIVHLLNNLFKYGLIGRHTSWRVVVVFGVPAVLAAYGGALLLDLLRSGQPLLVYDLLGLQASVTPVKLVIGLLILIFALFDLLPALHELRISDRLLPVGGLLSGFFGGLSGHQGAMRSTFLIKAGLDKESFIATGIVCSILVDLTRLTVYGFTFFLDRFSAVAGREEAAMLLGATLAAFVGALVGRRFLHKTTLRGIRILVGGLMLLTGLLVMVGLV